MAPRRDEGTDRLGATPARSALNLRLVLAVFGAVVCTGLGVAALVVGGTPFVVAGLVLLALAGAAVVDVVVVQRRRAARAEQERREHGAPQDHGLFE